MRVEIKNSTFCKAVDDEARRKIKKLLRYKYTWFRKGRYSKVSQSQFLSFMDEKSGFFFAGFLHRVSRKFDNLQIVNENSRAPKLPTTEEPKIEGIEFREDQLRAIRSAVERQRGVILFATASGKTVIAAGIISCFNEDTVFLVDKVDIVTQTYERFKEYGFDVGILCGTKKEGLDKPVLCATIQTYKKYVKSEEVRSHKVVIVDECHHVNTSKSVYAKVLIDSDCGVRIGLTGTLPNKRGGRLALEGLIGPIISRLSIQEGVKQGLLSKPKITLIPVSKTSRVSKARRYYDIKDLGIVYNVARNNLIVLEVKKRVLQRKSCLIIVEEIRHGDKILKAFSESGVEVVFLQGATSGKVRDEVKQKLIDKASYCVITTKIWNEGIDIPTLDVVVLAFVGKAATRTIQAIGRGLRRADGKERVEIIDFLDPYKYLAEHAVQRLSLYKKEGLL